ncbi:hypothetical protein JSY36_11165 [Bacillus sp. H-16]|uniref:DUF4129 domain-containing protein n=1 Tax=Alteribacter salitolerans TaxID=2912333 RepID=UPI001962F9D6|nr:hypothetical protein [Alteribacter salitolerans]MBM7096303.1 hypothetical protein [Alteribacter salitolerans]
MKKWQPDLPHWLRLSLEMWFVYLLLFPVYMDTAGYTPPIPFLAVVIAGIIVISFFIRNTKKLKYSLLSIPIVITAALLGGFHISMAIFLSFTLFWRVRAHLTGDQEGTEIKVLFLSLFTGVFYYLLFQSAPYHWLILIFLSLQFFGSLLVIAVNNTLKAATNGEQKRRHMRWTVTMLLGVGGMGLLVALFTPIITAAILFITRTFIYAVGWLMSPLLFLFSGIEGEDIVMEEGEDEGDEEAPLLFEELGNVDVDSTFIGSITFYWIVAGILFLLAFIYLIRKKTSRPARSKDESFEEEAIRLEVEHSNWDWLKKRVTPKHDVRRSFLKLETAMAKKGLGRSFPQTAEEWLLELPIEEEEKERIYSTYERVRYGEEEVSSSEQKAFKQTISTVIKRIKRHKEDELSK